jgi:hypothetical protein
MYFFSIHFPLKLSKTSICPAISSFSMYCTSFNVHFLSVKVHFLTVLCSCMISALFKLHQLEFLPPRNFALALLKKINKPKINILVNKQNIFTFLFHRITLILPTLLSLTIMCVLDLLPEHTEIILKKN